ncbi:MAG: hypothetical protein RLZZ275_908, partial [Bacteroidota bacterium]
MWSMITLFVSGAQRNETTTSSLLFSTIAVTMRP